MAGLKPGVRTGGFGGMKHVAEGLPDLGVRLAAPPGHAGVPRTSGGHREEGQSLRVR